MVKAFRAFDCFQVEKLRHELLGPLCESVAKNETGPVAVARPDPVTGYSHQAKNQAQKKRRARSRLQMSIIQSTAGHQALVYLKPADF